MCSRLFIFSFSVVGVLVRCSSPAQGAAEEKSADTLYLTAVQQAGAGPEVLPLRRDSVWETIRLVGRTVVLAHSQGQVHSRAEGTIERILVREGAYVRAGQVLFLLYSGTALDLQRQYVEAYQRYLTAKRRLMQQESLAVAQLTSAADLSQVRTEVRQLEAQLRALTAQLQLLGLTPDTTGTLSLLPIRAPLEGYITGIFTTIGEYVRPEKTLAQIVNLSDLHADLYLSERELSWLRPGMPVQLRLPALPELPLPLTRVEYVSQVRDTAGTTLVAHVKVPPVPQPLFAETPIEGLIRRYRGKFFQVPAQAVVYHGRQTYIFLRVSEGAFYPLPVQVTFQDTLALLESPALREGLPVVVQGASFLAAQLWQLSE